VDRFKLDELKSRFQTLKEINSKLEQLKAKQNSLSKLFGVYKRENRDINELKTELNGNKEEISKLQESVNRKREELLDLGLTIPNFQMMRCRRELMKMVILGLTGF